MADEPGASHPQPTAEALVLLSQPLAGPWPRYWARLFDIALWTFVLAALLNWLGPPIFGEDFLMDPSYDPLVALGLLPVALVLDALIQSIFGNSLGKFIAGIRVETTGLERPGLGRHLRRNFGVWLKGVGLGIPIVSLIALMACYTTARSGRLTSWDAQNEVRVFSRGSNIYRTLMAFGAMLALIAGLGALNLYATLVLSNQVAAEEIAKANESLPQQIDDYTRMDSIALVGGVVTYTYTLIDAQGGPSLTPMRIRDLNSGGAKSLVVRNYCRPNGANPQIGPTQPARYRYRTVEGQVVVDFTVLPQACENAL